MKAKHAVITRNENEINDYTIWFTDDLTDTDQGCSVRGTWEEIMDELYIYENNTSVHIQHALSPTTFVTTRNQTIKILFDNDDNIEFICNMADDKLYEVYDVYTDDDGNLTELQISDTPEPATYQSMLNSLRDFARAAKRVNRDWDKYNIDALGVNKDYPFDTSFDELVFKIANWVDKTSEAIIDEEDSIPF